MKMMSKKKNAAPEVLCKRGFGAEMKKNWPVYLMAVPGIILLIVFCYLPMAGVIVAFEDYSPALGMLKSPWVGLENFKRFFESPYFIRCIKNTFGISIYSIIVGFPAPIILALLLNELKSKSFKKCVQTVTYIPHFISMVVIAGMIIEFSSTKGIFNDILALFGVERSNLLMRPELFKSIYVFSDVWQGAGWNAIVYIAALTAIDSSLYEAAVMDGAGRWKQTLHVTIPGILPTIVTLLILRLGSIMTVGYEKIILLANAATLSEAETISSYVYTKGLKDMDFSYSTAVGLFNSVINLVLLFVTNKISVKTTDVGLW